MLGRCSRSRRPRGRVTRPRSSRRRSTRSSEQLRDAGPDAAEVERARNTHRDADRPGAREPGRLRRRRRSPEHATTTTSARPTIWRRTSSATAPSRRRRCKTFASEQLTADRAGGGLRRAGRAGPRRAGADPAAAAAEAGRQAPRRSTPTKRGARIRRSPAQRRAAAAAGAGVVQAGQRPDGDAQRAQGAAVVAANLVVKTGSDANPLDKPGLANFTAAMLDEGTATRTALQIADEVAQLGGSLTTGSTMDATQVTAARCSRTFPQTLDLHGRRGAAIPVFPADGDRAAARRAGWPARAAARERRTRSSER